MVWFFVQLSSVLVRPRPSFSYMRAGSTSSVCSCASDSSDAINSRDFSCCGLFSVVGINNFIIFSKEGKAKKDGGKCFKHHELFLKL